MYTDPLFIYWLHYMLRDWNVSFAGTGVKVGEVK
jgi:hypothetical protein